MKRLRLLACSVLATVSSCGGGRELTLVEHLGRATGPTRVSEARLSIMPGHAPCRSVAKDGRCGGSRRISGASDAARSFSQRLTEARSRELTPDLLHAEALAAYLWSDGSAGAFDRPISLLQSSVAISGGEADALSDLAALYYMRGRLRESARDLMESIEMSSRALLLDSSTSSARFNRALALQALGLYAEAHREWESAAAHLERSWSDEARERRDALTLNDSGSDGPQLLRERAWDESLGTWGRAVLAGDSIRARLALDSARAIGEFLARRGGDLTTLDAVDQITRTANTGQLAALHAAYAEGRASYRSADYSGAGLSLSRVHANATGPLRAWAAVYLGPALVFQGRGNEGLALVRHVAATADTARHAALAARAFWTVGTTLARNGKSSDALVFLDQSRRLYQRIGEKEYMGAVHAVRADVAYSIGDELTGDSELRSSLLALRSAPGSVWRHNALYIANMVAAAEGLERAARLIQSEDLAVTAAMAQPYWHAEARLIRARTLMDLGDTATARSDIETARSIIDTLAPGAVAERLRADLLGTSALAVPAHRARPLLDSAVAFFSNPSIQARLVPLLVARAEVRSRTRDPSGAMDDLGRAAGLVSAAARDLQSVALRRVYADRSRSVFDRIAMIEVRRNRADAALSILEQSRSLVRTGSTMRRLEADSGEAVVSYAMIGDTLVSWVLRGGVASMSIAHHDARAFRELIATVRTALEVGEVSPTGGLASLHAVLVRPLALDPGARLRFVVDGDLLGIPFAALRDSVTGRYLLEDHEITYSHAVTAGRPAPGIGRSLVVALPSLQSGEFPPLRHSSEEATTVAASLAAPILLVDSSATREAVSRGVRESYLFHFAGHAVFDPRRPEQSFLHLADGRLDAATISSLDLRRLRLVVLSACESARGAAGAGGGFASLGGAFLLAGAGGVVGSDWRIEDEDALQLMKRFYVRLRAGSTPGAALRSAQLELARARSPSAWAAFRYISG